MPIKVEWQVKPPSKQGKEDKQQMFPRITESEVIGEQQLAKLIAAHGTMSNGSAISALSDMTEVIAKLLREGKTIDLPRLGMFKLSIGTDAEIYPDSSRRMQSIVVRGVNFLPDRQLMDAIGTPDFQWKATTGAAIASKSSQIIPELDDYFKAHESITRAEFASLFKLKRPTANIRLKELTDMGIIKAVGSNRGTRYVKGEEG